MKTSLSEKITSINNIVASLLITLICIYPFYYLVIYSLSDPKLSSLGIYLLPVGFTFNNFISIFQIQYILNAFFVSFMRAVVGTVLTLFCSSLLAFLVTKKRLVFRRLIYRMVVVSMYINAGLIPWYMTMKMLGLKNNFLLYILPFAVGAFYLILIKTYFEQLPPSIEESAVIDGAGILGVYFRIIMPLSVPILAAVSVFSAVGQWNSWSDNFFLVTNRNLKTLQLVLYEFLQMNLSEMMAKDNSMSGKSFAQITPMSIRMTISVVSIIPIFIIYPLLQKYFIKGILLGAIKG
jgi:putative aldouronate transport system permease protein